MDNSSLYVLYGNLEDITDRYNTEFKDFSGLQDSGKCADGLIRNSNNKFRIGNLELDGRIATAPLAGISDNTFRIFSRAFGSCLNFTEMISAYGVHYKNRETAALSNITEYERPCAIQIFGSDADIMSDAAAELEGNGDLIDINMGCPVAKVLKTGSGGCLLTDEKKVENIIKKVCSGIKKPLTVKIRSGWDRNSINALNIARIAQEYGADAISIHARTVKQGFTGDVDYRLVKEIKNVIKIPVIASGDIDTPKKAKEILDFTGCDALMVGRGAKGAPWIFHDIRYCLIQSLNSDFTPSINFKKSFALLYLDFLMHFYGEEKAVRDFRKHFAWIFRGIRNISRLRKEFNFLTDRKEAGRLISSI